MAKTDTMRRAALAGLLLCGAFWAGSLHRPQAVAAPGVRETTPPGHFLAGSERALPLLEEISATLKQIDTRLAAIEKSVAGNEGRPRAASQVPQ